MSDREPAEPRAPSLPDPKVIEACLALLADSTSDPGTLELHDPLYLMRRDQDLSQLPILGAALEVHGNHPAAARIRQLLWPWMPQVERTFESVLAVDGPIPEGQDPLEELALRLSDARRVRVLLEERVCDLENRLALWTRTANVFAAVGALLAVVGIVGWLAALGALTIPWVESPAVEDVQSAGEGELVPAPSGSGKETP